MHYEPGPFERPSLYYNEENDYYVCPMGQHMTPVGTIRTTTPNGYESETVRYRAQRCGDARSGAAASKVDSATQERTR